MTRVSNENEIVEYVRAARDSHAPFEIVAGGTRRGAGKPMASRDGKALPVLDVFGVTGIVEYQPEELIVTARPGTQLDELKAVLAQKNQCLGFDPVDWTLFGKGNGTLGGAVSCDASGSGRLRHGPARDSLLGFRGVNGLGEVFHGGAKVVKNVTGFDLPKLMCGAFGTLAVLSELTFRVYPRPEARAMLILRDREAESGFGALRAIWKSALEPSGLAYVPGQVKIPGALGDLLGEIGEGAALIRFEAAEMPLKEKIAAAKLLVGDAEEIDGEMFFALIGEGMAYAQSELDVWRVSLPPSQAARVAQALASPLWLGDWAGGLLWIGARGEDGPRIRAVAAEAGGHAMLLRAPAARRAALGVFPPPDKALKELAGAVRAAFDPNGLFNPGRL